MSGSPSDFFTVSRGDRSAWTPVKGTIVEVNTELGDFPQKLNEDPYGEGWLCVIQLVDADSLSSLLDADGYRKLIES